MSMFEPVFERRVRMLFSEPGPHDDTLGERARALWREGLYQTFEATGIPPAKRAALADAHARERAIDLADPFALHWGAAPADEATAPPGRRGAGAGGRAATPSRVLRRRGRRAAARRAPAPARHDRRARVSAGLRAAAAAAARARPRRRRRRRLAADGRGARARAGWARGSPSGGGVRARRGVHARRVRANPIAVRFHPARVRRSRTRRRLLGARATCGATHGRRQRQSRPRPAIRGCTRPPTRGSWRARLRWRWPFWTSPAGRRAAPRT